MKYVAPALVEGEFSQVLPCPDRSVDVELALVRPDTKDAGALAGPADGESGRGALGDRSEGEDRHASGGECADGRPSPVLGKVEDKPSRDDATNGGALVPVMGHSLG